MQEFSHFVGIDISKKTLNYAVYNRFHELISEGELKNNQSEIGRMMSRIVRMCKIECDGILYCAEFTGNYAIRLLKMALKRKVFCWLEDPLRISSAEPRQKLKSDPEDARRIARYALRYADRARCDVEVFLEMWPLKELINARTRLVKYKSAMGQSPHDLRLVSPHVASVLGKSGSSFDKHYSREIKSIDLEIENFIGQHPDWKRNHELIQSIPGIGKVTGAYLIAITWNFRRLCNARKLASFCCMAPFSKSSGTSLKKKARTVKKGDKRLKTLLQMSVYNAIRSDDELAHYAERMQDAGKPPLVIANNIRNKLLKRIIAVVKRQKPYNIARQSKVLAKP